MKGVGTKAIDVRWSLSLRRFAALVVWVCASAAPAFDPGCAMAQAPDHRLRVLMLFSNDSLLPANQLVSNSIKTSLEAGAPGRLEYFTEYLDMVRFPEPEHEARLVGFIREKYARTRFDTVFALGPQALDFAIKYQATLSWDAPVIYAGVREESLRAMKLPSNAGGIASRFDALTTLELALRLLPDTQHIAVVTGASNFDRAWEDVAHDKFKAYEKRLNLIYLSAMPMQDLLRELAHLPQHSVVIYLSVLEDGAGAQFYGTDSAGQVAAAANAPVFAVYDTLLGVGIVGGYMNTFEDMGEAAAKIALRVLAGERPDAASSRVLQTAYFVVDWRQLRRWGLSEANLPAGTTARFKDPSLWDLYRGQIIALIAVLLVQSLLIMGLLIQDRKRRRAVLEAKKGRDEVTHLARVAILGELSGALAHELNQPLTAILSNAQAAQRLLAKTPVDLDEVREILSDIGDDDKRAGEVINRLHALMKKGEANLRPLDLNGLAKDVLELARSELIERNVAVTTRFTPGLPDIRGDLVQLQQVLLNLIMNACEAMVGNADADRSFEISTARDGNGRQQLVVVDRGPGVSPELINRIFEPFMTTKTHGLGLGLSICRSIVTAHGGQLRVVNNPDRGASFIVSLPIHAGGQA